MFKKIVFKNKLRAIICPMRSTRSVTVLILVGAGTKYERKKENGISHFLEHMCFKGTKKRPHALQIAKEIEGVGGVMNAFTGKDFTGYFVKVDFPHFELALDVVSDIFLHPLLKEEEIEKERGVILEEIKMIEDNPREYVEYLFEKLLYGDQPAGWQITGTRETVMQIKRKNLLNYIKRFYVASNTIVGIAGRVDVKKANILIQKYFSEIKDKPPGRKKRVKERQNVFKTLFFKKDTKQSHLAFGVRTFNLFHKDRYTLSLLATILGGNMSSRLFQELREKRGLAYYIATLSEVNPDTGYLVTYTGVDHKKVKDVVKLIFEEYQKIKDKGVKEEELFQAKEYLKGRLRLSLEDSESVASFYGMQELLENKILTPEEKIKEIEKVKTEDIKRVANEIFQKEKLNLAFISPKEVKINL